MTAFDPHQNYFELFQLPQSFRLDQSSLSQRYRDLQREMHPDRFAGGTDRERRLAIQYSAWINEAYQTLQSPVRRAQYLLSLQGMNIKPEQTMASDPAFLMHQISLRDQLMELKEQPNPEQALDDLTNKLDKLIDHQCAEFESSYNDQNYVVAKEVVMKMQFLFKLEEDAKHLEADILDY
jgi:molecular chaperone HscB